MYPEIKATVAIAVEQAPSIPDQKQQALAAKPQGLKSRTPSILQAGANDAVKLETAAYPGPVAKVQEVSSQPMMTKVVSICVDIPEKLVSERTPTALSSSAQSDPKSRDLDQDAFNAQFQKLKSEISKKVELTLLSTPDLKCDETIAFNLIPATTTTAEPFEMRLKKIAAENWPSGIVLLVGLILLVSISRGSDPLPSNSNLQFSASNRHPGELP
eukprot:COSAG04_NODE_12043_length_674_cov_0.965217_1_plen_214_part_01